MNTEEKLIGCYDAIAAASGRMLAAARAADWDTLVACEADCAALIAEARVLNAGSKISPAGASRRITVLRKVLADDAEIRSLTQPWLSGLDRLLSGGGSHAGGAQR